VAANPWHRPYAGWQAGTVTASPQPTSDDNQDPQDVQGARDTPAAAVPVLSDGVVTLRAHRLDDADAVVEQSTDPESRRWTMVPREYTRDHAIAFIAGNLEAWAAPDAKRTWAIEWLDEGRRRFGGTIDLRPMSVLSGGELGFGLHPAARGRGLMSRAIRLVTAYAFETGGWGAPLTRVHWRAIVGNWGSRRAAWAAGFTLHGTIPQSHPDPDGAAGALDTWAASIAAGDPPEPPGPWFTAPVHEADGLRLRPWRPDDVDAIEPRPDDPEHWMPTRSVLSKENYAAWRHQREERMASGTAIDWCVADAASDRALGGVTLFSRGGPMTGDTAELGYQLFPSARGRGVAKAAARLAIAHALRPRDMGGLGMRRLVAETAADNDASNHVLTANGFAVYGREHAVDLLPDGSYGDGLHWELISG
jgi:RimJ/RimL family protein N-acetyltransferase